MAKKSASDWAESLAATAATMADKVRATAESETREYAAKMIENAYLQPVGRKSYGGKTPDECIAESLAYPEFDSVARLRDARKLFAESGEYAEGLRVGLLLAARLIANEENEL